ncbi:DUF6629 family protein [Sphingomonas crusticola]|uniref:DUF6629 family protein n=1 Tax=Sphingomonas crusticola TaxID=1697973 RepID=UPI000E22B901|nr:DUF6629 family protein [Sphingomonas crusticola]
MCFSPTASFFAGGALASIGVATLRHVREPRTLLFASMPLLFALHQFTEGVVWLGLNGTIGPAGLHRAAFLFTLYAQGLLPTLMPAAVALMEPPGRRRTAIWGLTMIGAVVSAWDLYGLLCYPSRVFIDHHMIAYRNPLTGNFGISLLYILATCGALLLSSHRVVQWYGILNIIGLTIVQLVREYAFASVWCFYAAALSVMIYWQFLRQRISVSIVPAG